VIAVLNNKVVYIQVEEMMSNTIYFTLVFAVVGLIVYLWERYTDAITKKLSAKPSDTLKNEYKDL